MTTTRNDVKLQLAKDCILQDKIDFGSILRAVNRFRVTKDQHYIETIEIACETAMSEIDSMITKLEGE